MHHLSPLIVRNKRVLVRVDFNVDLDEEGNVIDDFRIQKTLPIIKFLKEKGAEKIILISHLGQPEKNDFWTEKFTLKPIADYLEKTLKEEIQFCFLKDFKEIKEMIDKSEKGAIWLLENIRYYEGEEKNDRDFARAISQLGDLYINEAFSVSHRETATICAITEFLPSYPGFLFEEEIKHLDNIITNLKPPVVIILGGAKVEDKLPLIESFSLKADWILIGGVMANTILKAWNFEIGDSLYEEKMIEKAKILGSQKAELMLPGDFLVLAQNQQKKNRELGQVEKGDNILDIGSVAAYTFGKIIKKAATIFWNGPMGKIEDKRFEDGTKAIIEAILENKTAKIVIGGGDTLMAFKVLKPTYMVQNTRLRGQADDRFFSTGGGALLKYLIEKSLIGLKALK
ncbi:MAG: phosphoglycerate kinase [Candidatus Paceibacterota bacterium]|jgi:phosphoglycerate kinase